VHSSKSVQICLFFIMFNMLFIYESSPFVFFYKVYVYIILLFHLKTWRVYMGDVIVTCFTTYTVLFREL